MHFHVQSITNCLIDSCILNLEEVQCNKKFYVLLYTGIKIYMMKHNIISCIIVPSFAPREALQSWQEKNHKWLELTDVHRETTNNIRITVMPFYMGVKVCYLVVT